MTAATVLAVLTTLSICLLLLCCSDYTVEAPTYLRPSYYYFNTLLFTGVILTQYFIAAATRFGVNRYHILPSVGGCVLLCGSAFFLVNALLSSKIRNLIFCRRESTDRKPSRLRSTESAESSNQSTPKPVHRNFLKRNSRGAGDPYMNLKGAKVLLRAQQGRQGRNTSMNPVPLSLFNNQVHQGRVRQSGGGAGVTAPNPAYRLDLTSSAV